MTLFSFADVREILDENPGWRLPNLDDLMKIAYKNKNDVKKYVASVNAIWDKACSTSAESDQDFQEYSSIYNNEELYEVEKLSKDELIAEFMFMGLRTCRGANLTEAKERFGIDVLQEFAGELEQFFADDLLEFDKGTNYLKLTESGMAVGNNVFEAFIK